MNLMKRRLLRRRLLIIIPFSIIIITVLIFSFGFKRVWRFRDGTIKYKNNIYYYCEGIYARSFHNSKVISFDMPACNIFNTHYYYAETKKNPDIICIYRDCFFRSDIDYKDFKFKATLYMNDEEGCFIGNYSLNELIGKEVSIDIINKVYKLGEINMLAKQEDSIKIWTSIKIVSYDNKDTYLKWNNAIYEPTNLLLELLDEK